MPNDEEQAPQALNEGVVNQVESDQCSDGNIDNYVTLLIVMSFIVSGVVFFFLIFGILSNLLNDDTTTNDNWINVITSPFDGLVGYSEPIFKV